MDDNQRLISLEGKVGNLETRVAVAESNIAEIRQTISGIKDNTTWILRLVIGGLVAAVIAFLVSGGFSV
ncbi:hemolysin XhlA family protein [Lysinibacillus sp. NPDC097162]|uniref:hemolysin XhlA family protein n=1 Tax=Lysinibacillus sp. NPDC097162 TaxID=3364140 RepID=UPI00382EAB63